MEAHEITDDDELLRVILPDWLKEQTDDDPSGIQSAAFDNTDDRTLSLYSRAIMVEEGVTEDQLLARWREGCRLAVIKAGDIRELGFTLEHAPDDAAGVDHAHVIVPGAKPSKKRKRIRDRARLL